LALLLCREHLAIAAKLEMTDGYFFRNLNTKNRESYSWFFVYLIMKWGRYDNSH